MVKILVKKFDKNIKLPSYKTSGSSGMDLVAFIKNKITINPGNRVNDSNWYFFSNSKKL